MGRKKNRHQPAISTAALDEAAAKVRMIKLIKTEPLSFAHTVYIRVDLPGWQGELTGRIDMHRNGALGRCWRYLDEVSGQAFELFNDDENAANMWVFPMTAGITRRNGLLYVTNWEQTKADLGEPASKTPRHGCMCVTWRKDNFKIEAIDTSK